MKDRWAEAAAAAGVGSGGDEVKLPPAAAAVANLLDAIPKKLLATAAFRCGAHARALQYFETHVRAERGGGLNPAAHADTAGDYSHDEVSG